MKQSIESLLAKYELEPSIKDLFVEGADDKKLMSLILSANFPDISICTIEAVEVSAELVLRLGFQNNHRGRVMALATILEDLGVQDESVRCVADPDFDKTTGTQHLCGLLLFYDFANLEMYFVEEYVLEKFFAVEIGASVSFEEFISVTKTHLQACFLMRLALHRMQLGIKFQFPASHLQARKSGAVDFDIDHFIDIWFANSGQKSKIDEFKKELSNLWSLLTSESRFHIHGEDLLDMLWWYLHAMRRRPQYLDSKYRIHQAMLIALEKPELLKYPFFQRLTDWASKTVA